MYVGLSLVGSAESRHILLRLRSLVKVLTCDLRLCCSPIFISLNIPYFLHLGVRFDVSVVSNVGNAASARVMVQ